MIRRLTGVAVTMLALGALAVPSAATASAGHQDPRHAAQPLVIAHRGASGYRPEHTLAAYELAVRMGADVIEPDLVMTKDGVLVDRHEPEISGTTDVASHPEFADRRTSRTVDGEAVTGWFVEDFTLGELRTLRAVERLPDLRPDSAAYDGAYPVPTFEEVLRLRARLSRQYHRSIGIIPEIKHSTYLHAAGLDPERALVRAVTRAGLNHRDAPLWTQSFEWTNLVALRERHHYRARLVFLASRTGGPYDLEAAGVPRTYEEMLSARSLRRLARTVDAIGPDKRLVIPWEADDSLGGPTRLVTDAHAAGLAVTPWTFRAENTFLPADHRVGADPAAHGRMADEVLEYLRAGVDGVFCDQPDVCVAARERLRGRAAG
ncbi:glycerophosphodiester phosphodiesterase [Phycicoccus sp. CSK15P-2]|uniref:glycerophosphodiester phosphodiesterase n=1 Tax=Phycicoccus sp. CSK15P-2 TaxID=2807627 RepID=UPI001950FBA3|nr:glycerophosphodiester phosphodiesterase [Phycicoccus sp. CSK15P-2]MBM6403637.1 glycerophosphodiester phosphodiesterase [Phycicoccus sp. CSK15P-2]MBM6405102.1 glycerophosphodiester phosphodiesterase [Phycicoccus sp. CSK15P-2]